MHNKLYERVKKFLKENYKLLIIDLLIISMFLIPTGYEIYSPGSLLDISKRVNVENGSKGTGSINATYVSAREGTIVFYLLEKVIPSWDKNKKSDITLDGEDYKDALERQRLSLKNASNNATLVAYNKAKKEVEIKNRKVFVLARLKESKTNLLVGDQILKINNKKINELSDIKDVLKDKNENDIVKVQVRRDKKIKEVKGKLVKIDGEVSIGIYLQELFDLETDPKIKLTFKDSESGPSAGLMTTLYIYNSLTKFDITKGLKVSGTGTIDIDGKVGEIDGVKYKLAGAVRKKADVFIVPSNNYKEAIKEVNKHKYKIKIIEAKTFDGVLKDLSNM